MNQKYRARAAVLESNTANFLNLVEIEYRVSLKTSATKCMQIILKHNINARPTTKHGHCSEIATHTPKQTNSASKTHTKNGTGNATDDWVKMCTQLQL